MTKNQTLITAAGGNGTAIEILDQALTRQEYESRGKALEGDFAADGVEQAGFLIPSKRHFEMAGGEVSIRQSGWRLCKYSLHPHESLKEM